MSVDDWDWAGLRACCEREARRVLEEDADVQDAVQEALARAWCKRDRCKSPSAPRPWLRQIARNEALRVAGARPATTVSSNSDLSGVDEVAVEDVGDRILLSADVARALGRLSPRDQALAHLRYQQDLEQTKIASLLGMPDVTIRVRLHRLRQRLTHELGDL